MDQVQPVASKPKTIKKEYIFAIGRRREAVARIRLYPKKDILSVTGISSEQNMTVNGKPIEQYFSGEVAKGQYLFPFKMVNAVGKHAVSIRVRGGGQQSQLQALMLGIARALNTIDDAHRKPLKEKGLLTVDARARQRRKVGMGGKSRRKKQSPKR